MAIGVTINRGLLKATLDSFRNKAKMEAIVARDFKARAKSAKRELVAFFENHPVTQEIKAGPNTINTSGTLGGKGNLFSFIGFYIGDDPTGKIKDLFNEAVSTKAKSLGRGKYLVSIGGVPSKKELIESSPIPWASGLSWVEGIEEGIIGLGSYLPLTNKGRSEGGLQIKSASGAGSFQTTKYLLSGIDDFINDL